MPRSQLRRIFDAEVRARTARRVFDRPTRYMEVEDGYICADGMCVMVALIQDATGDRHDLEGMANVSEIIDVMHDAGLITGEQSMDEELRNEVSSLIGLNDRGGLATPSQVRRALGVRS